MAIWRFTSRQRPVQCSQIYRDAENDASAVQCSEIYRVAENDASATQCSPTRTRADCDSSVAYGRNDSLANKLRKTLESESKMQNVAKSKHWILDSAGFQVTVSICIVANTVLMGVEADHPEWSDAWRISETFFTCVFGLELLLKLAFLGRAYFLDSANWLDATLVLLSFIDMWVLQLLSSGMDVDVQNLTILRVMQVFRLARVLRFSRIFRLPGCHDRFMLILSGVVESIRSTCCIGGLLLAAIYAYAVFCTDIIGRSGASLYPGYTQVEAELDDTEVVQDFNPYLCFGSMARSMLTLFNMVLLTEWHEVSRPLALKQPFLIPLLIVFVIFTSFGLMNVIIGLIVDNIMKHIRYIMDEKEKHELNLKLHKLHELQRFVANIDRNHDGRIAKPELEQALNDVTMQSLLKEVNMPRYISADELLDMLNEDGDATLEGDEFLLGFYRLIEGDAFQRACISQISINKIKSMVRQQHEVADATHTLVRNLEDSMQELRTKLQVALGSVSLAPASGREFDNTTPTHNQSLIQSEPTHSNPFPPAACVLGQGAAPHQLCGDRLEVYSSETLVAGLACPSRIQCAGSECLLTREDEALQEGNEKQTQALTQAPVRHASSLRDTALNDSVRPQSAGVLRQGAGFPHSCGFSSERAGADHARHYQARCSGSECRPTREDADPRGRAETETKTLAASWVAPAPSPTEGRQTGSPQRAVEETRNLANSFVGQLADEPQCASGVLLLTGPVEATIQTGPTSPGPKSARERRPINL